jgi:hypothetical protein
LALPELHAAALQSGNGVKEYAMNSDESTSKNIEWGRWIILAFGMALFLFGAWRFVLKHHFGFLDAIHCCLAVIPAGLLLLVIAYVVQHAKLASVVPLAAAVALLFSSPVFDVALGLVLMGAKPRFIG